MKKIIPASISLLATAVFSLFLISCEKDKKVVLTMAEPNSKNSISARMDAAFAQKAEELSGGLIKINLFTDSALGNNETVVEIMTKPGSNIHIARAAPGSLVPYGCNKANLLNVPYTFSSREHFWKFAESSAAKEMLDEPYLKNVGVKGLYFAEEGFRHFFSVNQVKNIDDFKGKNTRTSGNSVLTEIIQALGSEVVSVGFSNLYSAFQTGEVEIAEQPIVNYLTNHFNKVAPYMILDGHQLGVTETIITTEAWNSLSEKQKDILIEAGKYATEYCRQIVHEAENKATDALKADGVEFIEVKNIGEWQKACADVINRSVRNNTELYGEILSLAN